MSKTSVTYRQVMRNLQAQPPQVRGLAVGLALVLIIGVVALGTRSSSSDRDDASAAGGSELVAGEGPGDGAEPGSPDIASPDGVEVGTDTGAGAGGTDGQSDGGILDGTGTGGSLLVAPSPGPPPARPPLTASDRGVTPTSVKVVFPWFDLTQYTSVSGTTTNEPLEAGPAAISAFVNYVNANGGLDGRKIDAQIEEFNPLNETDMRAKCREWAQDDKVFAVVDSSAWHSDHQLCLTEDNDTPLVTQLGLSEVWTKRGAPYLWWPAPTTEEIIADWILWAAESGQLTKSSRIGVVTGVKEEEKLGKAAIERALKQVGMFKQAKFREIPGYTSDIALAQPAIASAISDFKQPGEEVDKLLMGLSPLVFTTWMQQAESQEFYPHYLLSDFNNAVTVAEALIASSHPEALKGAMGTSYIRLGEIAPKDGGSFAPAQALCNKVWRAADPSAPEIYEAGVAMRWCDNIFLFAEGARRATRANDGVLTRKNWAAAMGTIRGIQAGMTPTLTFGPRKYSGVTMTKVVKLHTDEEEMCTKRDSRDDAHCLVEVQPFQPIRRLG